MPSEGNSNKENGELVYFADVLNTNLSGLVPNIPYQLVLTAYNFNGPSLDSPSVTVWACALGTWWTLYHYPITGFAGSSP